MKKIVRCKLLTFVVTGSLKCPKTSLKRHTLPLKPLASIYIQSRPVVTFVFIYFWRVAICNWELYSTFYRLRIATHNNYDHWIRIVTKFRAAPLIDRVIPIVFSWSFSVIKVMYVDVDVYLLVKVTSVLLHQDTVGKVIVGTRGREKYS